jgi:hypothetical protein
VRFVNVALSIISAFHTAFVAISLAVTELGASSNAHTASVAISAAVSVLSWISEPSIVPSVILSPQSVHQRVRFPGKLVFPFKPNRNKYFHPDHHCLFE